jgi:hypothetical protein
MGEESLGYSVLPLPKAYRNKLRLWFVLVKDKIPADKFGIVHT